MTRSAQQFPPMEEVNAKSNPPYEKGTDFETAIAATKYGKFSYLLLLVIIPVSWASSFDTSNMSMILSSAECDLGLTLIHKGVLNAIPYAGMVSSALVWGFLADVLGRRRIIVYGFFADGICNILNGLSQNFTVLVLIKFISGFIVSGPYASIMSYATEFHGTKDRPRVLLFIGFVGFIGCMVNAALAWAVIPRSWTLVFGNDVFVYNSWRIYLSLCGVPLLIGAACLTFFPESPKFLMSQGRNEEALEVFKTMYSMNTGQPRETYPILSLENEVPDSRSLQTGDAIAVPKSIKACIHQGLLQMKPLFLGQYLTRLLMVISIQFCIMLAYNTIRLWQPQLFAIVDQISEIPSDPSRDELTFCQILDYSTASNANSSVLKNASDVVACVTKPMKGSVYLHTIIITTAALACIFLAGVFVNLMGNKNLLLICSLVSIACIVSLNWSPSILLTVIITCFFVGLTATSFHLVAGIAINVFPTSLRTMAVSLAMMVGRFGSLLGNVLFPIFLEYGCLVAIIALAVILIISIILTLFVREPKGTVK